MIINGKIVVVKERSLDLKTKAVGDVCEAIHKISNKHGWELSTSQVIVLAKEFIDRHYLEFTTKNNGCLSYPLNRLEHWALCKRHGAEAKDSELCEFCKHENERELCEPCEFEVKKLEEELN